MAEKDTEKAATAAEAPEPKPVEVPQKFRVLHGAISGRGRDKKGDMVERDFHRGSIVTDDDLDGQSPYYFSEGAIVPVE